MDGRGEGQLEQEANTSRLLKMHNLMLTFLVSGEVHSNQKDITSKVLDGNVKYVDLV